MASTTTTTENPSGEVVRFGIVGAGGIAVKNAAALHQCAWTELVMVGARNLEKAQAFSEEHKIPQHGSLEEVVSHPDVDAVYICLPTGPRKEWVLKAIAHGKHVLVEKPLANTVADAQEQTKAAENAGVIFMDGTMWPHATRTKYLQKVLWEEQVLGPVLSVTSAFTARFPLPILESNIRGQPQAEPLGAVGDLAWYTIGITLYAFQYELPLRVATTCARLEATGNVSQCHILMEFANGRSAVCDVGYTLPLRQYAEIVGRKGWIRLDEFVNPSNWTFDSFFGLSVAKPTTFTIVAQEEDDDGSSHKDPNKMVAAGVPTKVVMPQTDQENKVEGDAPPSMLPQPLPTVTYGHETEMFCDFAKAVLSKTQNPIWIKSSLATQAVVNAVMKSIENDGQFMSVDSPF